MPGYNECSIYNYMCREGKCQHPTRTGVVVCDRCDVTINPYPCACRPTGKPVNGSVEPVQAIKGLDGRYSLTGLSEDDMWTLWGSLGSAIANAWRHQDTERELRLEKIIGTVLPD